MLSLNLYDVIRKPIVSEKSTNLLSISKYSFEIDSRADKLVVKKAVEKVFNVKVSKVNVQNKDGDVKFFKGRKGVQKSIKKAVVTLMEGYVIDFIGGVK